MKGGTLEFDIVANNDGINKALNETEKRIAGFSKATVEGGKSIDAMFDATNENIRIQKQVIKDLESEYAKLEKNIKKVGPGRGQDQLQQQANVVKAEIEAEKNALTQLEAAVKKNEAAHVRLRTQLRNVVEQLAAMEQAGQRGTDAYKKLQAEAGRLTDAMGDAQTQAKILAHDNAGLQGVISAVSGVAGAFSAAQGTIGLFAGENENLQKIMVKVQSLMAITIGLQQVANTLNKDSYFRLVTLTRAKQMFSAATLTAGKALVRFGVSAGVARVAATALMATLTFGLSAAITGVVVLFERFRRKAAEAKKAQEDFNNAIVEAAVKPITAFKELQGAYNALGDDMEKKQRFIDTNKTKFQELGVSVTSVKEAEDLLVRNSSKFIESCMLRAKAIASQELAVEKYKEVLKAQQKLEATPKAYVSKKGTYTDGYGTQRKGTVLEKSSDWKKAEEAVKKVEREYDKLINQQVEFTTKEKEILASLNQSAATTTEGSIAAIEENIRLLKTKYKEATDDTTRDGFLAQIKEQETLLKKLDKSTTSGGSNNKDPFITQLETRKKAYQEFNKWLSSSDEGVRKAAKVEFAELIKEGDSYETYLRGLKDRLAGGPDSEAKNSQLKAVTNELIELEKSSYMDGYKKNLEEQLVLATGLFEKLEIIAQKRKELEGDDSGLTGEKGQLLDDQQEDVVKQQEQQTQALLGQYADYLGEKITFEASYAENSRLLNENLAKAKTEDERRIALEAIKNLDAEKAKYAGQTGNADYDALLGQFKSYQQKRADITADYDAKIALASEKNNAELVARLEAEKKKALSSETLAELLSSDSMTKLLGNLDDLTTAQIQAIIDKVNGQKAQLAVELDPADLEVILSKLQAAKDEVQERNPFKALSSALKAYKEDASKANLGDIFTSVAGSIDLVKGAFDSVVGGLTKMGLAGDEVTQDLLGDIGDMLGAASELASGIATGNPLAIISGSVGLISSAFEVFNVKDRKAERAIKKHAEAVKELETAYKALEHAVDKALGESVYDNQKALINNMRQQQVHLQEMARQEENKKKTDHDKVKEYQEQYAELGRQIEDMIADIAQSITQTSAKDLASQLADTIAETMADGFDSSKVKEAIEKVTTQVLQNAVKNALKLQFLEAPLQAAVSQLQQAMGFDLEGNGSFDGLTDSEQQAFKDRVAQIAANYAEAMKMYEDLFKSLDDDGDPSTSLSGAIKGASQESIDLLAGQTNAVRVNQVVSIDILRQQLIHIASIDNKVSISNQLLSQIYDSVSSISSDPLRAQGITL